MAKKVATRRELLVRWRGIEEVIGDGGDDVLRDTPKRRRLQRLKEDWFSDAFNFLIDLPSEDHIWCGSWELMGPLLETFYNYSTDESNDSPLKLLWKRMSVEMRKCTLCISQHHQAQDMYSMEYDSSSISPLLSVLRSLDEERVGQHLKEINARLAGGEYIPERDNAEVVSVMFEVLTFPCLFDDQSLVTEFQIFIETIDDKHELTLEGHQQYPGVYALFFFKRRVRTIGHRLAGYLGKLREATELEPLQPFLKKCIGLLETDVLPSTFETSRPRVQLERISVWLGIKALLGFLEPPALEEGILERYPIFFSIVLNHISDDSLEFSHAVVCLRLLFEMLGYKLWLRSTLSPTMMRNTLLSQCFHTQNEKSHKEIFDLFQPFLQSLQALQDGEHEQQRRHFIYFLLHQVNVSRNFSSLMRKKACQIALLIILRGYKMNPPSPPFECAHMWGPSLVSSLKDSSLENSLRRPAFDLIETLIVSDAAALVTSMLNCCKHPSIDQSMIIELDDEEDDDELPFVLDVEEKHSSSWSEYSEQSKITSQDCRRWRCIPMLWLDVLVEINPSVLPISVSKAVFWARSRFALVEPEKNAEMEVTVKNWLSFSAKEISSSFGWKVPTGSDDGGDGKESQNSMKVSTMCIPLIRTFKRLTAHYIVQMEQEELRKQWIWEPRMGESLILLLLEPNDNVRQVGKCLLEQVSNMRGLAHCLQFLCSCTLSMSATYNGLRHALRLVQVDSVLLNFETLHHFFFVLCKLLKEGVICTSDPQRHSSGIKNISKFSSQGGFLRQPAFDSFPENVNGHSSVDDSKSREKFSCLLSEITWPFIRKCLVEGKAFVDYKISQLTCARLLEILPVVFEKLQLSFHNLNGSSGMMVENVVDFKWLLDLMDWGKSRVPVIARYWRQTMISLLHLLKGSCSDKSASFIRAIENLISCDSLMMDELTEQVAHLSVSLSNEASCIVGKTDLKSKAFFSEDSSFERQHSASDLQPFASDDMDVQILDSVTVSNKMDNNSVIILSDDETEKRISSNKVILSDNELSHCMVHGKPVAPGADKEASQDDLARKSISEYDTSKQFLEAFQQRDDSDTSGLASQKQELDTTKDRQISASHPKPKSVDSRRKEINSKFKVKDSFPSQFKGNLVSTSDKTANLKIMDQAHNRVALKTGETAIKESVRDIADDPWELAVKSLKPHQSCLTKPSASIPKRQVIQLQLPGENRSSYLRKLDAGVKRFKPPKLDDWYRPILEIDYFVTVGLASASKDESQTVNKLKEVPMCFESPDQYVDIFRPLVLEEFKAQLHSSFLEMSSSEGMCCGSASVLSVERIDDFHLVRCVHDGSDSAAYRTFSENDLVLLTRQPLQNSSHEVHMVGKVERREKDSKSRSNVLVIRFYLQNGSSRLNRARKLLIERSKWYLSRVMSITSQLREFHALSSINDIPILPMILKPFNGSLGRSESRKLDPSKLSQPLQRILESSYNSSQLQAISVAIASPDSKKIFDLSLIQGPPGTGKTRTIVAIVSGLLASPLKGVNMKNSVDGSVKQSSIVFTNSRPKMSQSAAVARAWQDAALARQLNEDVEQSLKPMGTSVRQRVLICAQSNAAVDELVSRISSEGLYSSDGNMYKPYLVRVGNVKTVHQNSLPFFIDTLVDQRLVGERMDLTDPKNDLSGDTSALRASLEKLVERIRLYEAKRANLRGKNSELKSSLDDETPRVDDIKETSDAEIEVKLRRLYEQKKEICRDLATAQAQERKANEESKALKHKLRKSILREAEIVVATLSGCGGDLYGVCSESISTHKFGRSSENHLFDAVVIDEAAQALEPATLIPLQLLKSSGTRCIMVGDPKQLPATVLSSIASKFRYQCSMFERLQRAGYPVTMLTKQYRMHPEICRFPSLHFYDSKLLNGENMSSKLAPFHETEGLGPYVFFDVVDGQESHGKNSGTFSLCNECEADAAVEVLRLFRKRHPSEFVGGRIGIITPYKCQLSLLRSRFSSAFGSSITSDMEFNTVDGFQGREVDILVLSTVRAAGPCSAASGINSSSIGFVADVRRMNVALTRAKLSLWILGNARTLQTNCNWAALVKDAKERNLVISAKMPYQSMFKKALKNPSSENSDYSSRQSRHGKTDITSKRAKQNEKNAKEVCERKENSVSSQSQINKRKAGDEHDLSARKEDVQSNKRRASEQCDFLAKKKFPSSVVAQRDSSTSKDVKSSTMGNNTDGDGRSKESKERQLHLRSTHLGKGKCTHEISQTNADRSEQEMGDGNRILKPQVLKGTSESLDHRGNQKSMEASTCSAGSILEENDASDRRRALKEVDTAKDVISKRKQQREAVDALLSSALIPSKKSAASLKAAPAKRSLSPALNAGCDINLPKPRKAKQGQIRQHRDKKHRTGDEA